MEFWYPAAIRLDGPASKTNNFYEAASVVPNRGLVIHSMEGSLDGALRRLLDPTAEVSWHFSNGLDALYQHYPITVQCWHAHAFGNVNYIGCETENEYTNGAPNHNPMTDGQLQRAISLTRWLSQQYGWRPSRDVGWHGIVKTLWEHNEVPGNSTQCPSGRIRWYDLTKGLIPLDRPADADFYHAATEMAFFFEQGWNFGDLSSVTKGVLAWAAQQTQNPPTSVSFQTFMAAMRGQHKLPL